MKDSFLRQYDKASQTDVFTISRETSNLSTSCKRECDFDFRRLGIDLDDFYVQGISVISDDPSFNKLKEALSEAATIRVKGDAIKITKKRILWREVLMFWKKLLKMIQASLEPLWVQESGLDLD